MKLTLTAIFLLAVAAFNCGAMTGDWRFFAISALASATVIAVGVYAVGWRAVNPFGGRR